MDDPTTADGTLLVPIANAETATRQLDTAIDLATDRSYRIVLLYVLEVPPQLSLQDGRRYLLEDEDEQLLADAADRVESAGIPVESRIRIARGVATGIVGGAEEYAADAILLGWRGRPPREEVILGSYLDTILRNAPCDVLVKRVKTPTPEIDSVLVPLPAGHTTGTQPKPPARSPDGTMRRSPCFTSSIPTTSSYPKTRHRRYSRIPPTRSLASTLSSERSSSRPTSLGRLRIRRPITI